MFTSRAAHENQAPRRASACRRARSAEEGEELLRAVRRRRPADDKAQHDHSRSHLAHFLACVGCCVRLTAGGMPAVGGWRATELSSRLAKRARGARLPPSDSQTASPTQEAASVGPSGRIGVGVIGPVSARQPSAACVGDFTSNDHWLLIPNTDAIHAEHERTNARGAHHVRTSEATSAASRATSSNACSNSEASRSKRAIVIRFGLERWRGLAHVHQRGSEDEVA